MRERTTCAGGSRIGHQRQQRAAAMMSPPPPGPAAASSPKRARDSPHCPLHHGPIVAPRLSRTSSACCSTCTSRTSSSARPPSASAAGSTCTAASCTSHTGTGRSTPAQRGPSAEEQPVRPRTRARSVPPAIAVSRRCLGRAGLGFARWPLLTCCACPLSHSNSSCCRIFSFWSRRSFDPSSSGLRSRRSWEIKRGEDRHTQHRGSRQSEMAVERQVHAPSQLHKRGTSASARLKRPIHGATEKAHTAGWMSPQRVDLRRSGFLASCDTTGHRQRRRQRRTVASRTTVRRAAGRMRLIGVRAFRLKPSWRALFAYSLFPGFPAD